MQHYKSIKDIPQWNWGNCGTSTDLRYCRVDFDPNNEDNVDSNEDDATAYEVIRDEYVLYFGLNKDAIKLDNLKDKLISHRLKMMITGSLVIQNYINRVEHDIKELVEGLGEQSEKDSDKHWMHVISKTNFPMDTKNISAYNYRLVIENHNEEIERQNAAIKKQMKDGK